jgi:tetratricopeptide (TPR) repeat protein
VRYLDQEYEAAAVGRELQVDSVLEGTLQRAGDQLRANLQMVDVSSGRVVWADSVTSDIANVLRGQESLANRVSQLLALSLSGVAAGESGGSSGSANLEAQEAYLRGALALATSVRQVSNIFAARDHYEQALRLDPDYAPALAGLATAYTLAGSLTLLAPQEAYPKAEQAARRALELDPGSAAAHIALAEIEADYNWNWEAAEANNRRALELAPNLAAAHQSYAEFLARFGRFAEAAAHSDLAQALDPTRINYAAVRALHLYYEHRFTDAISQGERVIARDPDAYLAHLYLSVANAAQGDYAAGLEAGRRASALTGGAVPDLFVLACNHALLNDRPATAALLQRLRGMERKRYVDPFHFVAIYAYLGEPERAFEYLETSYARRSYWMTTLKVHPVVDSLRADPRFAEMLERMKLE